MELDPKFCDVIVKRYIVWCNDHDRMPEVALLRAGEPYPLPVHRNRRVGGGDAMPRARSDKSVEAEKLYHSGKKLVDIARDMSVPDSTVRCWKSDQDWDKVKDKSKKNKPNARKKSGRETERSETKKRRSAR